MSCATSPRRTLARGAGLALLVALLGCSAPGAAVRRERGPQREAPAATVARPPAPPMPLSPVARPAPTVPLAPALTRPTEGATPDAPARSKIVPAPITSAIMRGVPGLLQQAQCLACLLSSPNDVLDGIARAKAEDLSWRTPLGLGETLPPLGLARAGLSESSTSLRSLGTIGLRGSYYPRLRWLRRREPAPQIVIGIPDVAEGALDRDVVRRIVRRYLSRLRFCYEAALLVHGGLRGHVVLRLTIDGGGAVARGAMESSTVADAGLAACIAAAVRAWAFPRPTRPAVSVTVPLELIPDPA